MSLETKLIVVGVLAICAIIGVVTWNLHEQHKGATKCEQANTTAADKQIAAQAAQLATYKTQLEAADARHNDDLQLIARAAAAVPDQLVCHEAHPSAVPQVPTAARGEPAAPGNADAVHERSFDPGPAVRALSVAYERRVETARDALNRWPK